LVQSSIQIGLVLILGLEGLIFVLVFGLKQLVLVLGLECMVLGLESKVLVNITVQYTPCKHLSISSDLGRPTSACRIYDCLALLLAQPSMRTALLNTVFVIQHLLSGIHFFGIVTSKRGGFT